MTNCAGFSNPLFENNVLWQNRSFYIGVGTLGAGTLNQQNIISLYNAFGWTQAVNQTAFGQCVAASYWDIGVRGDTGPTNHGSGFTLNPAYSFLTDSTDYPGQNNSGTSPSITTQYCNGSRVPPTCSVADGCGGPSGYGVPPGIVDASSPNPVFTLTPSATVDEGNNWVNVSWGPLAMTDDSAPGGVNGNYGGGGPFGNYTLATGSPAIDYVPLSATTLPTATYPALAADFFGNPRPDIANPTHFDVGAVEAQGTSGTAVLTGIVPNSGTQGTVVSVVISGSGLAGATAVNVSGTGITVGALTVTATTVSTTFTIAPTATLGGRNVTVTTGAGTSNAVVFTVVAPAVPTLSSILPATEVRGTSQAVVLTGTNFVTGSTVNIVPAATGVSVSGVTVVNSTTIDATITSTTAAAIGNVNVGVTTAGGASNTLPFAITGPTLTSISPASGNRGTTGLAVTLTGTGLTGTTAVNFANTGVMVTGFTVTSATTVTATINIAAGATAGAGNVTVTGAGGTSNAVTFTVTVPPIGLTSISPNTGVLGTTETVTLTGISFQGTVALPAHNATSIGITGSGISYTGFTVVNDTTITASFTISSATSTLGAHNITVATTTGATTPVTFTVVNPGTPVISSLSPSTQLRGSATPVTITGQNFVAGSTVAVVAPANGLTVSGVTVVSTTSITATLTSATTATIGAHNITVTNAGGTSNAVPFNVTGPVITSIVPATGVRGQGAINVSIFGSGLTGTTAVVVAGGTVGPITVVSDSQITTTFTFSATTTVGGKTVNVTAPGGTSNGLTFMVTAPTTPTLTSITPSTGLRGTAVPVTLVGNNFVPGQTTIAVTNGGITVSGFTVDSATSATATFTIATTASTTAPHNVTVTVTGNAAASNALPFTVTGPALTAIAPTSGFLNTTVPVTFTGTNLSGVNGVTGLSAGVTLVTNSLTVVSSTEVTASLAIAATATTGVKNVGLSTTAIGNTNTVAFTVQGAAVTISAPTPTLAPTTPNTATETATMTVSNSATANGNLTLTAAPAIVPVPANPAFSITGGTCASGTVVAPGGSCTIIVQYAPGASTATVNAHVTITGTGMSTPTLNSANFTAN